MFTRIKQFILVAVLGAILSVVWPSAAVAEPVHGAFGIEYSSEPCVAPCTVTVTDESLNTHHYRLTHEWQESHYGKNATRYFGAGDSRCLNAKCSQAQWTYTAPGSYGIAERVSWPGGSQKVQERIIIKSAPLPPDTPAPIILATPTTISLPTVLEVLSPKIQLHEIGCTQPALHGSEWESCELYLLGRTGPDAEGFYHYRFRFVIANPGVVEVMFAAWNAGNPLHLEELAPEYADHQTFTLNVTGNAYQFGDVLSCSYPSIKESWTDGPLSNVFELDYYSTRNSWVKLELEEVQGNRWVAIKRAAFKFQIQFKSAGTLSPWTRRSVWAQISRNGPLSRHQRIKYQIQHVRKVLKKGYLSKQPCRAEPAKYAFEPGLLIKFWAPNMYAPWK